MFQAMSGVDYDGARAIFAYHFTTDPAYPSMT